MTNIENMSDEEFCIYITKLINQKGLKKYSYEIIEDKDGVIHELTYFKSSIGWEVRKEDLWED